MKTMRRVPKQIRFNENLRHGLSLVGIETGLGKQTGGKSNQFRGWVTRWHDQS